MRNIEQTLLEQMRITEAEVINRRQLLDIGPEDFAMIVACRDFIHAEIDEIVAAFFQRLTTFAEAATLIGDADTLRRLHTKVKEYIVTIFAGNYGLEYINDRLRIGLLHKRIGVPPKLYLSGMYDLAQRLEACIARNIDDGELRDATCRAVRKMLMFSTTLAVDTYIRSLVGEIEAAKDSLEHYARDLEKKVAERTRELEEQARRDGLTGLYNRASLSEFLTRDLSGARRNRQPLCLVYFDVDDFKEINDTRGHAYGDRVLQTIGGILRTTCRDSDIPCRYGGDEFCILLPNTARSEAEPLCDRIIRELTQTAPEVGISIGIVQCGPESFEDTESLLKRADEAMYHTKRRRKQTSPQSTPGATSPFCAKITHYPGK